jgi:hypothetical protein
MGDKPLMKKITLLILSAATLTSANLSVKQIENMVIKIHQKRPGADNILLDNTHEPFAEKTPVENNITETSTNSVQTNTKAKLKLHAIMAQKAFINDQWLDVNDTIEGYQLKYIGKRGVVLQSGNDIKTLMFNNKKDSLIKIEGR